MQTDRDGKPTTMWKKMPANQLAKCSESLSLRKAFPAEMSSIYTHDEMGQADRGGDTPPTASVNAAPQPQSNPQPANPEASARPWRNFRGMLESFSELRGRLAPDHDHVYAETLAQYNVAHSNEFKDSGQAVACYNRLLAKVLQIEAAIREDIVDVEMPDEDFDQRHEDPEATA
jgi:hypothetical protein